MYLLERRFFAHQNCHVDISKIYCKRTVTSKKMRKKDFVRGVGLIEMGLSVMPESYTTLQICLFFMSLLEETLLTLREPAEKKPFMREYRVQ